MNKRLFTTVLATAMAATTIWAVPAKPGLKKTVLLADGSSVELTLHGDEHYSFYTNDKGIPCQTKDGALQMMNFEEVGKQWTSRRQQRQAQGQSSASKAPRRVGTAGVTIGERRGLVILMQFADVPFVTENPQQTFSRYFNEEGYSENGAIASVRDYFIKQSYGQLTIDFDVVGPFTTNQKMEYYGGHYTDAQGDHNDAHPVLMVSEAVDAAHDAGVDFRKYDWVNDGEVGQVFVIYAGYNEAQGADANTIWPHEWVLAAENRTKKYNGVTINTYGCASELRGSGKPDRNGNISAELDGIGTACHEFSHCLGLPDMYDTQGDNYAMAYWDVMCAGSYNSNSNIPAGYTSYERWFSGWMEPTEINSMTRVTGMAPLAEKPEAYVLYNEKNRSEYYLLENRQPVDFDQGLYGHGLLILHVDYSQSAWESNSVNTIAGHERMTIIAADNNYVQTLNGMAGDPFPGTRGVTELTNYTTPAATLYNNNVDGTKLMSKPIDNITEDVAAKTVSFVVCRPELPVPAANDGTAVEGQGAFSVTWSAVDGAVGYQLELTEIGAAATDPSEALLREFDFSGCVSKSNGFTDISSKLGSYGLTNWSGSKLYTSPNKLKIGTSTTAGYITTPSWWAAPSSLEITFVMGADVVTSSVEGTLKFETAINGGSTSSIVTEQQSFEVTGNGLQVFSFTIPKQNDLFRLTIQPSSQMYLNYLAIYDGIWTAEQLGISAARAQAPHYANAAPQYFESATNSYTFTGLNTSNRYIYRVRAIGEENTYSQWSEEKTFAFPTTGIWTPEAGHNADTRYYDLQGRRVDSPKKGVYIRDGRKVVY